MNKVFFILHNSPFILSLPLTTRRGSAQYSQGSIRRLAAIDNSRRPLIGCLSPFRPERDFPLRAFPFSPHNTKTKRRSSSEKDEL